MLTHEQLVQFADHGWVLLESVVDEDQCKAYRDALDHFVRTRRSFDPLNELIDLTVIDNMVLYDDLFLDWFKLPGVLDANRQLMGAHLHLDSVTAHIKVPHPDRHMRAEELADMDRWSWHRGMRPKWGIFPHD